MASDNKTNEEILRETLLLDIPPRLQWNNGNGYCGETSVQSIALNYGAWISQKLIHDINRGEYVLQKISDNDVRDPLHTLTVLHFKYDEWDWMNAPQPQFRQFCRWMKRSLLNRHPVMFGIFLPDGDYDDYDHIVPAIGIQYRNQDEYDKDDELIFYDLYEKEEIRKNMNEEEFGSTRETINEKEDGDDGCLPLDIDYGIAITGILDENQVTLLVHLSVSAWNEPNPAFREDPSEMDGIIKVSDLTVGEFYAILRYSSYEDVPIRGDENAFLQSQYESIHEFMATETTYVYEDPKKILSTGSVYYRCIRIPQ